MQEGPIPRPRVTNKFAAVKAAPRDSGGLTLMMHGRIFTEGREAIQPPRTEYSFAL